MKIALETANALGWLGHEIDRLSGGKGFAHCELILSSGDAITSLVPQGLSLHRRDYPAGDWAIYDIGGEEVNEQLARQWYDAERAENPISCYDFAALARWASPHLNIPQNPHDFFCSEAVVSAVQWAMGMWGDVIPWQVAPNDLIGMLDTFPRIQ